MRDIAQLDARSEMPDALAGAIVALGNFDGFHLGHQAVVREAIGWAREEGRPALVATFDPHPVRFFVPDAPPFRLTTLHQRRRLFAGAGADAMLVFAFDAALAGLSAEGFAADLASRLRVAGVVTGTDFTFGKGRQGNAAVLAELGSRFGYATRQVAPVLDRGSPVSSSRIRDALVAGDPEEARRLLTRSFAIEGVVVHGDKRGRKLGFPTANVPLGPYLRPRFGIYAATARLSGGEEVAAAVNIGTRPQFDGVTELLEAYLLDWSGDLYGQEIEVALHHFIRPEARFASVEELTLAMQQDVRTTRSLLA